MYVKGTIKGQGTGGMKAMKKGQKTSRASCPSW
jgi:hypothetical protein